MEVSKEVHDEWISGIDEGVSRNSALAAEPGGMWTIWESLPCYLIDHCEGEIISEEGLQRAVEAMLKNPQYSMPLAQLPAATAAPDERAEFEAWYIAGVRKAVPAFAEWSDSEIREGCMRPENDSYRIDSARIALEAWQARAALSSTQAAAQVVLPEPDAAIKEVMGLVEKFGDEWESYGHSAGIDSYQAIESKLRALLATGGKSAQGGE